LENSLNLPKLLKRNFAFDTYPGENIKFYFMTFIIFNTIFETFPLKKNKYNDKIDSREVFARLYACGGKLKKI